MYSAIAANKRNTFLIMALFVAMIGALGWMASYAMGNTTITYVVVAVAFVYALIQYFLAGKLAVAMTGARPIEKADNPRLWRIVENLAITTGMPMPKLYLIDDPAPNAFATGRDPRHAVVGATTGLLEIMDDRELEAVMAHEVGHVQNYDIRVATIAFGLVSAIGMMADIVGRMLFFGSNSDDNDRGTPNPLLLVFGLVVMILAPLVAMVVQMAVSRQREYLADASSVLTTRDPEAMMSALAKLDSHGQPMRRQPSSAANLFLNNPLRPGFFTRLFSTHPPIADRIARLQKNSEKL